MTTPTGDVLTESRAAAGRVFATLRRRVPEIVIGIGVVWTLLCLIALGAAALDDNSISSHRVTTSATVLEGSDYWRSVVRFVDSEGRMQTPGNGVFYPSGLTPGQNIYVDYDETNPSKVRVSGRSALGGILPTAGAIVAGWVVLAPLAVYLRRRRARRG
ncbi:DUF3592 domain-containing protein [Pseudonocardia phyllosphaerae]|uniref:DUF3592 domain-containing protein n=1 Tax=Pseudonocardia phyllosphaerae TaxID=3390502 RepID=UPI00397CE791